MKKGVVLSAVILIVSLLLTACSANQPIDNTENNSTSVIVPAESEVPNETEKSPEKTGVIAEQILNGNDGEIHYSYYLPEDYDESKTYPLVMTMPGYGMMWFGEDSSGSNLEWNGFRAWTELPEDVIVVSAQLTDWHETSARQAIELTEYFIENFSVDKSRVYAAGYSAGGETMSQAVSMRPDLYAAYLHGASQWDGDYQPIAQNDVAVYIFMAENDEYYGSEKARSAYDNLQAAYREKGYTDEQISELLALEIPDNEYFNSRGIYNYHGGGNIVFDDETVLSWILSQHKVYELCNSGEFKIVRIGRTIRISKLSFDEWLDNIEDNGGI